MKENRILTQLTNTPTKRRKKGTLCSFIQAPVEGKKKDW
jgi:hypothetical protein